MKYVICPLNRLVTDEWIQGRGDCHRDINPNNSRAASIRFFCWARAQYQLICGRFSGEFRRWKPPTTARSAIVDWHDAIGPGCKYSVWFGENEEGAEARSSACGC